MGALTFEPPSAKISVLSLSNLRKHNDEYGHRSNNSNFNSTVYRKRKQQQEQPRQNSNKMKRRFRTTKQHKINHYAERMDVDQNRNNFENCRIPKRKNHFLPKSNRKLNEKKRKRENGNDAKPMKKRKKMP